MAMDTNRVLRIGVVYRGQILAERVLDRRFDVSIGTRADCVVQIAAKDHPDFPAHVPLAMLHRDKYHLVLPEDPNAQVNLRGGPPGSAKLSGQDVISLKNRRVVPIEGYTGGSVAVGDIILMFQFVRGDSVPTATHEEVVLRIGLVHDSRLLSDQIFKPGQTVKVGSTKDCDVVLPEVDYRGDPAVFRVNKDGQIDISLPAQSGLRLAVDGSPLSESEAIAKGVARRAGKGLLVNIGMKSRGRAALGPYTLLFQVIRRTVTVPTMPRKSLLGQIMQPLTNDPVWSVSFLVSVLLVGSVVIQAIIFYETTGRYLRNQQFADEHIATTYEVLIEEKEEEPPPEKVQDVKSEEAKKAEQEEIKKEKKERPKKKKPEPKAEKPQSTGKTVDPEQRKRNARKVIAKTTIAGALMGKGGASTKLFAEGGEGEATVIAKSFGGDEGSDGSDGPSAGVKLAGGGGGGGTVERVGTGKAKGFGKRNKNMTKVAAKKVEKRIRVSLSSGSLGGSGSGKKGVGKVIARKASAVRRCYEKALRKDSGLSGKVKVRFTVGTAGTITSVSVIGVSGDFAKCIKGKFQRIRGLPLLPSPQSFTQSYVFTKS